MWDDERLEPNRQPPTMTACSTAVHRTRGDMEETGPSVFINTPVSIHGYELSCLRVTGPEASRHCYGFVRSVEVQDRSGTSQGKRALRSEVVTAGFKGRVRFAFRPRVKSGSAHVSRTDLCECLLRLRVLCFHRDKP